MRDSALEVDVTASAGARGSWVHPTSECVEVALSRKAFGRALRIAGTPDTSAVVEHFARLAHPGKRIGSEEHEHTVKSRR